MKLENDPGLVVTIRQLKLERKPIVEVLRFLTQHDLAQVEIMSHFREAFGLEFGDVSCIAGWFPDGAGELTDDAISSLLDAAITLRSSKFFLHK